MGIFFASINVFGGFVVTQRMLNLFTVEQGSGAAKGKKVSHH